MRYDVFLRLGGSDALALPQSYPYTITILTEDGRFDERTIRSSRDLDLRKAVSVKLHKPSAIEVLAAETAAELGITNADRIVGLKTVLYHLLGKGLLKVDGQPSLPEKDWLDHKMDELGIRYDNVRKGIRAWFENPAQNPEVNYDLGNSILTVKPSGGGRVVVLPTGHTIAYTTAREIYWQMLGNTSCYGPSSRPSVGEYLGRRGGIRHTTIHRLTVNYGGASVGCQSVPRQAILDLAKREGWSEKPTY